IRLRTAIRLTGRRRLPVPYVVQRTVRSLLAPIGITATSDALDYLRYSWTISADKLRRATGFEAEDSSAAAIAQFLSTRGGRGVVPLGMDGEVDPFGMDREYIDAYGRSLFRFLERYYWRIEVDGVRHLAAAGRAVLVGVHRGFMPWDGVMAVHLVVQ